MVLGYNWDLPGLVSTYKKRWKDPPFLMGKSTISTRPVSRTMLVCQRVCVYIMYVCICVYMGKLL